MKQAKLKQCSTQTKLNEKHDGHATKKLPEKKPFQAKLGLS